MEEMREETSQEEALCPCQEAQGEEELSEEGQACEEVRLLERERRLLEEERFLTEKEQFEEEKSRMQKELQSLDRKILERRKKLKDDELFFDQKMEILKGGFAQLENDRKEVEMERMRLEAEREAMGGGYLTDETSVRLFFRGVSNMLTLRKRYKDLIKIFHPDNLCGDTELLQRINETYEILLEEIGWQKKA